MSTDATAVTDEQAGASAPAGDPAVQDKAGAPGADAAAGADQKADPGAAGAAKDLIDNQDEKEASSPADADLLSDDGDAVDDQVPDAYQVDHLEGLSESLDDEKLAAFMEGAKENKLTQAQFDFVLDRGANLLTETREQLTQGFHDRIDSWRAAASEDKTIGGEKLGQSLAQAKGVLRQFADQEFRSMLGSPSEKNPEGLGFGNHPATLRFLNRIAAVMGDPAVLEGDGRGTTPTESDRLFRMYPSMDPKNQQ